MDYHFRSNISTDCHGLVDPVAISQDFITAWRSVNNVQPALCTLLPSVLLSTRIFPLVVCVCVCDGEGALLLIWILQHCP